MPKRTEIVKKLGLELDPERFGHSLRVEKIALKLGKRWGVSEKKITPAALLHDCARRYDRRGLLRIARKLKIKIDPIRAFEPKLLHAEIGARLAKKEFGVRSPEILRAIQLHTVGSARMTKLEKIIYLADHIEEERDFPGVKKMRRLAFKDLDLAIIESTTAMIKHLLENGLPIYPGTVQTRNYFLL